MSSIQRGIVLRTYPSGLPVVEDFDCVERPLPLLGAGQVMVETWYLSMDPAPRMRMNAAAKPAPMPLGEVVVGRGVGIVLQSQDASFKAGDLVAGDLSWQEQSAVAASSLRKVDESLGPVQLTLGILGPSGIAAWCLVHAAAMVRTGETVVVTAAAGGVGSVALQLAHLAGARVIAVVGSAAQARFVREQLGVADVVDHTSPTLTGDLERACPQGVSVFLDSVGGPVHNAVMQHIAVHARIIAFGYISAYHAAPGQQAEYGRIYQLIQRRAVLRGFLVGDYASQFSEALEDLAAHLSAGRLRNFESCVDGLENAPRVFTALFSGEPVGKQMIRLAAAKSVRR